MSSDTNRLVLGPNECLENGIKTKIFVENGRAMLRISAETKNHLGKEYFAPVEDAYIFYPLYFYYDFHYEHPYKDLLLKLYSNAPEKLSQYIYENFPSGNVYLKKLYDFKNNKPINDGTNFIKRSNEAIEFNLKKLGLTTWRDFYNKQDIKENFAKISKELDTLENSLLNRAINNGDVDSKAINKNTEKSEEIILGQANDEELRLYIELGVAYRMTVFMSKVVKAKEDYLKGV